MVRERAGAFYSHASLVCFSEEKRVMKLRDHPSGVWQQMRSPTTDLLHPAQSTDVSHRGAQAQPETFEQCPLVGIQHTSPEGDQGDTLQVEVEHLGQRYRITIPVSDPDFAQQLSHLLRSQCFGMTIAKIGEVELS
jgi:hypothetical protein